MSGPGTSPRWLLACVLALAGGCGVADPGSPESPAVAAPAELLRATPITALPGTGTFYGAADAVGRGSMQIVRADGAYRIDVAENVLTLPTNVTATPALADFDFDGDLDGAFLRTVSTSRLSFRTQIDGSFVETQEIAGISSASGWRFWDVDDDGDLDLVGSRLGTSGTAGAMPYDGGTFGAVVDLPFGQYAFLQPVDWDGDGDLDAIVQNGSDTNLYLQTAPATFAPAVLLATTTGLKAIVGILAADFDGDGRPDLAVASRGISSTNRPGELAVHLQEPDGTVDRSHLFAHSFHVGFGLAAGDVDADGDLDLVTSYTGRVAVFEGDGTGVFSEPQYLGDLPAGATQLSLIDLDGDRTLDLLTDTGMLLDGWVPVSSRSLGGATLAADAASLGDWDGDGDLDLAVGGETGALAILANEGGALTPAWTSPETDLPCRDAEWADWDLDGDLDLAVALEGRAVRIYENEGGSLSLALELPEVARTRAVAWGDWDGDGDPDLATAGVLSATRVYENDGGSLTLAWTSPETDLLTNDLAWADVDSDDDLDLVEGNNGNSRVRANDGEGDFTDFWVDDEGALVTSLAIGDIGGDGVLDLVLVGSIDRVFRMSSWGLNDVLRDTRAVATRSARIADVDQDGREDLVREVVDGVDATLVWTQVWGGSFRTRTLAAVPPGPIVVGDLDQDGDEDIAVVSAAATGDAVSVVDGLGLPPTRFALGIEEPAMSVLSPARRAEGRGAEDRGISAVTIRLALRGGDPEQVRHTFEAQLEGLPFRPITVTGPDVESTDGELRVVTYRWVPADDGIARGRVRVRVRQQLRSLAGHQPPYHALAQISAWFVAGCYGPCCSELGELLPSGERCRRAAGPCDVAETCDGTSPLCPNDAVAPAGTVCRPAEGDCDVEDRCDGTAVTCRDVLAEDGSACGGLACGSSECMMGSCLPMGDVDCDDDNVCTVDSCAEPEGCAHERIEGCCRASFECSSTPGAECVDNVCVPMGGVPDAGPGGGPSGTSGCGCRAGGGSGGAGPLSLLALVALVLAVRRRAPLAALSLAVLGVAGLPAVAHADLEFGTVNEDIAHPIDRSRAESDWALMGAIFGVEGGVAVASDGDRWLVFERAEIGLRWRFTRTLPWDASAAARAAGVFNDRIVLFQGGAGIEIYDRSAGDWQVVTTILEPYMAGATSVAIAGSGNDFVCAANGEIGAYELYGPGATTLRSSSMVTTAPLAGTPAIAYDGTTVAYVLAGGEVALAQRSTSTPGTWETAGSVPGVVAHTSPAIAISGDWLALRTGATTVSAFERQPDGTWAPRGVVTTYDAIASSFMLSLRGAYLLTQRPLGTGRFEGVLHRLGGADPVEVQTFGFPTGSGNAYVVAGRGVITRSDVFVPARRFETGFGSTAAAGRVANWPYVRTLGEPCASRADCGGGFCIDGVCCDSLCNGGRPDDCVACSTAAGAEADGTCGPMRADAPELVCRAALGICDVAESCQPGVAACPPDEIQPEGTMCRAAVAECDAPDVCDGYGVACPEDQPRAGGTACALAEGCEGEGICEGFTCVRSASECDDGILCTADSCGASGCEHTPVEGCCSEDSQCDDGDPCTADTCFASTGVCESRRLPSCRPDGGALDGGTTAPPATGGGCSVGTASSAGFTSLAALALVALLVRRRRR